MMTTVFQLLLVQIAYVTVKGDEYELILHEGTSTDNNFANYDAAFLTNVNDPTAELYSIVGLWNDNTEKQNAYKDDSGKYQFKLVYTYADNSVDVLIFKQSTWINSQTVSGYELVSSSGLPSSYSPAFVGLFNQYLARSKSSEHCYIGSNSGCYWTVASGPSYSKNGHYTTSQSGGYAQQVALYVLKLESCDDVTCPFGEVCDEDTAECAVHCSTLDIDAYVNECSSDIATQSDLDAIHDRIDGITVDIPDKESTIPFINNDTLMMALLLSNILLLCYVCYIHTKVAENKPQYKTVKVYSSEEEDKPINQF